MRDGVNSIVKSAADYADLLRILKERIRTAQVRAALSVNRELVPLYWQIGRDILAKQAVSQIPWGHIIRIMQLIKDASEREWFIRKTIEHGWSRPVVNFEGLGK